MRKLLGILILIGLALPAQAQVKPQTTPPSSQQIHIPGLTKSADQAFAKHNYREALVLYQQAWKQDPSEALALKLIETEGKLKHYDASLKALAQAQSYIKTPVMQARLTHLAAQLYQTLPQQAFKRNGQIFRDPEPREGEVLYLYQEDQNQTQLFFVQARKHYETVLKSSLTGALHQEIYDFNRDFSVDLLTDFWLSHESKNWPVLIPQIGSISWDTDWPKLKQIYALYQENLHHAEASKNPHAALLESYRWAQILFSRLGVNQQEYPLQDPLQLLQDLVRKYPTDSLISELKLLIGDTYEQRQAYSSALEYWQLLLNTPLKAHAEARIQELKWPALSLSSPGSQAAGQAPQFNVSGRNLEQVDFKLYRLRLNTALEDPVNLHDPERRFLDIVANLGDDFEAFKEYYQGQVTHWDWQPKPDQTYAHFSQSLKVPQDLAAGAYLLEAHAGSMHAAQVLLVSDAVLSSKQDNHKTLYFLAHAETGKPLANADLKIKVTSGPYNKQQVRVYQAKTNADGIYSFENQPTDQNNRRIEAFAQHDNHYAISGNRYGSYTQEQRGWKLYAATERPLYRPGQTVYFKHLLRAYREGDYQTPSPQTLDVQVRDARGETVYKQTLTSNPYGSLTGSFKLAEDAALGSYNFSFDWPKAKADKPEPGIQSLGQTHFQVEAYKKPEYKVEIATQGQLIPGQKAEVKIRADYFSGGPVKQGKVQVTVSSQPFFAFYDYFYDGERQQQQETILQESLTLDDQGEVKLKFETQTENRVYRVTAEVTDASRREVVQTEQITLTREGFFARINLDRGFYQPQEKLSAEINLLDANRQTVPHQAGTVEIQRLTGKDQQNKELWKSVFSEAVRSNAQGRIFVKWQTPSQSDRYRLHFSARDARENPITAELEFWVSGRDFSGQHLRLDGVEILTDKRLYSPGDTAKILIQADEPDATIWYTQESDDAVLSSQVLRLKGNSTIQELKLSKAHQPNLLLAALSIQGRKVHHSRQEIFVPALQEKLQLTIKTPVQKPAPATEAELELHVRDHQNRPVQGEFSLALVDAALYQLLPDSTPAIHEALYGQRRSLPQRLDTSLNQYINGFVKQDLQPQDYDLKSPFTTFTHLNPVVGRRRGMLVDTLEESSAPIEDRENNRLDKSVANEAAPESRSAAEATPIALRSNFQDTAYWNPTLITNTEGIARIKVPLPDNLTTWRIQARGWDQQTRVGQSTAELSTHQDIQVRLQHPRFLVERDEVVISANLHNESENTQTLKVSLATPGQILKALDPLQTSVTVAAHQQARVDWRFKVIGSGELNLTATARGSQGGDAVKHSLPVKVYGALSTDVKNGALGTAATRGQLSLNLPAQRIKDQTRLKIQAQPSLAASLLDALPYLAEYPYGCIEQTTSRFVPAVMVANTLDQLGINLEDLIKQGDPKAWQTLRKNTQPLRSRAELQKMIDQGLQRLQQHQNSDGGWGWWPGGHSDPYISTYVLDALQLAAQSKVQVDSTTLSKGLEFLRQAFQKNVVFQGARTQASSFHLAAYQALVLSRGGKLKATELEPLFVGRDQLNPYSNALLAQAYQALKQTERAKLILNNLKSFVRENADSASWDNPSPYWYWYGDRVETNATLLQAFLAIQPNDPLTPKIVRWLVDNRQGNRWHSTKDTARAIYALSGWIQHSGESKADYSVDLKVNGKTLKTLRFAADQILNPPFELELNDNDLKSGDNLIEFVKQGSGNLYYSAALTRFSQAETIAPAGNHIAVERKYSRIQQVLNPSTRKLEQKQQPLKPGDTVKSGDEIEVQLTVTSPNDYSYLMFEDFKPAGFEAVESLSGYVSQNGSFFYREFRDDRVVMFLNSLKQGTQVINYRLRAETPGIFHALPHQAEAMYAPQIQANSSSWKIEVID